MFRERKVNKLNFYYYYFDLLIMFNLLILSIPRDRLLVLTVKIQLQISPYLQNIN